MPRMYMWFCFLPRLNRKHINTDNLGRKPFFPDSSLQSWKEARDWQVSAVAKYDRHTRQEVKSDGLVYTLWLCGVGKNSSRLEEIISFTLSWLLEWLSLKKAYWNENLFQYRVVSNAFFIKVATVREKYLKQDFCFRSGKSYRILWLVKEIWKGLEKSRKSDRTWKVRYLFFWRR